MNNVEIDKLKETLEEYADYAIKLVKENKRLQQENKQLKEDKKKAIEYIQNHQLVFEISSKKQISYWFDMFYKDLLEILGSEKL